MEFSYLTTLFVLLQQHVVRHLCGSSQYNTYICSDGYFDQFLFFHLLPELGVCLQFVIHTIRYVGLML